MIETSISENRPTPPARVSEAQQPEVGALQILDQKVKEVNWNLLQLRPTSSVAVTSSFDTTASMGRLRLCRRWRSSCHRRADSRTPNLALKHGEVVSGASRGIGPASSVRLKKVRPAVTLLNLSPPPCGHLKRPWPVRPRGDVQSSVAENSNIGDTRGMRGSIPHTIMGS